MIAIIGAMEEEVNAVKDYLNIKKVNQYMDMVFYEGTIDDKDIVLMQGGIGKVNAAVCTTVLLEKYDIDYVLNVGSAGGLHLDENVGDVIISSDVIHHDVDVCAFGYELGQVPQLPLKIPANDVLCNEAKMILNDMNCKCHFGTIVSGDQFIHRQDQIDAIKKVFPDALCSEMEAASLGQVCYKYHIPFLIIRSLSDVFGKGESAMQFDEYIKVASQQSALFCKKMIERDIVL